MDFSEYQVNELGKPVLLPAFCITFFTNVVVNRNEIPEGLLKPYHKIRQDFMKEFHWASYDFDQKRPRAITEAILSEPDRWLKSPDNREKDCAFIELYGGKSSRDLDFPFFYWDYTNGHRSGTYYSVYRLDLPLNWNNNLPIQYIDEYIYQLVDNYPLVCGYAGYTVSGDQERIITRDDLKEYIYQWHQRHPGIMNVHPLSESQIIAKENVLFAIGWITLLGEALCNQLGGVEVLRNKLSHIPEVIVKPLPQNGALIRIGDKPQLGDSRKNDVLDSYHAVGKVLAPVAVKDFDLLAKKVVVSGFRDNKECAKWLGRFFQEK
ncbi:type VI immunity family protein [Enterobacter cloacae complex sp. 2024EL-00215]|uniref:type VI immunity family protein n=1 Tax=unclassified Enterobacter cloacae complex TaxID=2757714 RepID=UPI0037536415